MGDVEFVCQDCTSVVSSGELGGHHRDCTAARLTRRDVYEKRNGKVEA